jgi:IS30 family transposase
VNGNGGVRRYRACRADSDALRRVRRPKPAQLAVCSRLRTAVEAKLELRWSPQQISGWLVEEFPDDPEMRVSHETIYVSLFVQSRGALRKELARYLRSGHTTRRPPWQRGSNENTNGLLRQYFPKRTEIAHFTQAELDDVAAELNGRPRQTLGWRSPSQALDEALR